MDTRPTRPVGDRPDWVDHGVSALNAWIGDQLASSGNALHIGLSLYHENRPIELTREALLDAYPRPTNKVCLFVHGLGINEGIWTIQSGGPRFAGQTYGSLLQRDRGFTPLYLRYNSGLAIATNGLELSRLLSRLLEVYPVPIEEVLLIGYSMGGLVVRSACHQATESGEAWVRLVRRVFYIGSPHLGAPLEKAVWLLSEFLGVADITATRVLRDLLNTRSRGIKDLRFGSLTDDEWLEPDPYEARRRKPVAWLPGIRHYRIAGTLTPGRGRGLSRIFGDGMVSVRSATGHVEPEPSVASATESTFTFVTGAHHLDLPRHPEVYAQIERWLDSPDNTAKEMTGASQDGSESGWLAEPTDDAAINVGILAGGAPLAESTDATDDVEISDEGDWPAESADARTIEAEVGEVRSGIADWQETDPGWSYELLDEESRRRLKGLKDLLHFGVDRGVHAIEGYQKEISDGVFDALESIPPVKLPAGVVRHVYGGTTRLVYDSIRAINWMLSALGNKRPGG